MIVAENITKYYGARAAVDDISFSIQDGEVIGLLGLNGAGKTTTLRILSGLLVPSSGRLLVDGVDMAESPELARSKIGFLPETSPLYPEMTVEDFLVFVARINGVRRDLDSVLENSLVATDLLAYRQARIETLSHGYRRRVGIASAIVHNPALILLDEPTGGLDPVQIVHMRRLIRNLRQKHTVIVSSHILGEIHQMCDRIFVLQHGRIVAWGSEEELSKHLRGVTQVKVEVRGCVDALAAALKKAAQVAHHTIQREADGIVEATVELQSDTREDLARVLTTEGLGLRRLDRVSLELENIFLNLTGEPEPNFSKKKTPVETPHA
ncbi:MAG: ABC transporter ATP-binding protein [Myxococcota bacterium]